MGLHDTALRIRHYTSHTTGTINEENKCRIIEHLRDEEGVAAAIEVLKETNDPELVCTYMETVGSFGILPGDKRNNLKILVAVIEENGDPEHASRFAAAFNDIPKTSLPRKYIETFIRMIEEKSCVDSAQLLMDASKDWSIMTRKLQNRLKALL